MDSMLESVSQYLSKLSGTDYLWMIEVFVIVLITLIAAFVLKKVLHQLEKQTAKTKTLWDDALLASARRPGKWVIWLIGLCSAIDLAALQSDSIILNSVDHIRYLGTVGIVTWFLTSFIKGIEKNVMNPDYMVKPMDQTTSSAIAKLLRASVVITSALVVLQYFDVRVSGILAFGGIGGIAVGFAAKDLLANFFGGLMIYLDRPFSVGDWIRSHDKEIEGTVENIGWRLTCIRTFDKRPLYVPNATFTQIAVENPSRMTNRRIYETIGVRYDDAAKVEKIVADVKTVLKEHEAIDLNQTLMVNFNAFASSSMDFFIYCFTKTTNWAEYHEIKQDVLLKVLSVIESHGAECAFPTSTVHIPEKLKIETRAE